MAHRKLYGMHMGLAMLVLGELLLGELKDLAK